MCVDSRPCTTHPTDNHIQSRKPPTPQRPLTHAPHANPVIVNARRQAHQINKPLSDHSPTNDSRPCTTDSPGKCCLPTNSAHHPSVLRPAHQPLPPVHHNMDDFQPTPAASTSPDDRPPTAHSIPPTQCAMICGRWEATAQQSVHRARPGKFDNWSL